VWAFLAQDAIATGSTRHVQLAIVAALMLQWQCDAFFAEPGLHGLSDLAAAAFLCLQAAGENGVQPQLTT
jgi:hypothetical protein